MEDNRPVIPRNEYMDRWEKVKTMMDEENLDLLIAHADDKATFGAAHARWLVDFPVHFEPVCIMFTKEFEPIMLVGPETLEYAKIKSTISDIRVLKEFTHTDEDYPFSHIECLEDIIAEILKTHCVKRLGVDALDLMGAKMYETLKAILQNAEWVDIEYKMCMLRAVKTPAEIAVIRHAYRIAELGINAAVNMVSEGVTEREIAAAAEVEMRKAGSEGAGIDTIVASGINSMRPLAGSGLKMAT